MATPPFRTLFYIPHLYHWEAVEPLYRVLSQNQKDFDVTVFVEEEQERRFLFFKRPFGISARKILESSNVKLIKRLPRELDYELVITTDVLANPEIFKKAHIKAIINHGTGIKTVFYRLLSSQKGVRYHIFVEGHFRERRLKTLSLNQENRIFVLGYPKFDYLFSGEFDREKILQKLNLNPALPTVLYAPTYKPTSLPYLKDEIFNATRGMNLIIKLHPYFWTGIYASKKWTGYLLKKSRKFNNAVVLPFEEFRIMPYVLASDIVISEASSVLLEFLAAEKFGVIFDLEYEKLKHHDGMPILDIDNREFLKGAYVHIKSAGELKEAIEQALHPTDEMRKNLKKYKREFLYGVDGRAAQRIAVILRKELLAL